DDLVTGVQTLLFRSLGAVGDQVPGAARRGAAGALLPGERIAGAAAGQDEDECEPGHFVLLRRGYAGCAPAATGANLRVVSPGRLGRAFRIRQGGSTEKGRQET